MKILTKLMLASAVMVTSGFAGTATEIAGEMLIGEGGEYTVATDTVLTGKMTLAKTATDGEAAILAIEEDKTLEIQGGELSVVGEGAYGPTVNLDGTMKLTKSGENYPVVKLDGAAIVANSGECWKGTLVDSNDYTGKNIGLKRDKVTLANGRECVVFKADDGTQWFSDGFLAVNDIGEDNVNVKIFNVNDLNYAGIKSLFVKFELLGESNEIRVYVRYLEYCNAPGIENETLVHTIDLNSWDGEDYFFLLEDFDLYCDMFGTMSYDSTTGCMSWNLSATIDFVVNIVEETYGRIDCSTLRAVSEDAVEPLNLTDNIDMGAPVVYEFNTPFNIKCGDAENPGMDLTNVDKVTITKLVKKPSYKPYINGELIETEAFGGGTYGDYVNDPSLGVKVDGSKCEVKEVLIKGGKNEFDLRTIAEDETYNAEDGNLKINTTYLSANAHELAEDFTYNVGFTGTGNPIKISGTDKVATFKGDASGYAPNGNIELTSKTIYAGNNSFIKVNHAYGELEFAVAARGGVL